MRKNSKKKSTKLDELIYGKNPSKDKSCFVLAKGENSNTNLTLNKVKNQENIQGNGK
jgi:hypothetical protein